MKAHTLVSLAALTLVLASPAGAQAPTAPGSSPTQADASATHLGVGTIRNVDADRRTVTIEHQAIPSLNMPAMTMPFRLAESVPATSVKAGQSVAFFLSPKSDGVVITSLQTIAALPQASSGEPATGEGMPGMQGYGMGQMHGMNMMDECHKMMAPKYQSFRRNVLRRSAGRRLRSSSS